MLGPQTSLVLQKVTQVTDGAGGFTDTWADEKTISGVLTKARGDEKLISGRVGELATHIFYCDYSADISITPRKQFVLGSRTFDIIFVYNPGNMGHHLEVKLQEIV